MVTTRRRLLFTSQPSVRAAFSGATPSRAGHFFSRRFRRAWAWQSLPRGGRMQINDAEDHIYFKIRKSKRKYGR